jgi:hypothetical protein
MSRASLVVILLAACGGSHAAPTTPPPGGDHIGYPSPVSQANGYEITPSGTAVAGPPPSGASHDAGALHPADAGVPDAQAATSAPTQEEPDEPKAPEGLPPTPGRDGGPGVAPALGDASVPRAPIQPL